MRKIKILTVILAAMLVMHPFSALAADTGVQVSEDACEEAGSDAGDMPEMVTENPIPPEELYLPEESEGEDSSERAPEDGREGPAEEQSASADTADITIKETDSSGSEETAYEEEEADFTEAGAETSETEKTDEQPAEADGIPEKRGLTREDGVDPAAVEEIEIFYDDYYDVTARWPGYIPAKTLAQKADSYSVEGGKKTGTKDRYVAAFTSGSPVIHAVGCGTVTVYLAKKAEADRAWRVLSGKEETEEKIPVIQLQVTVRPAPLTIIYLMGQSNMVGLGKTMDGSVVCERGTVYSTFLPEKKYISQICTGVDQDGVDKEDERRFIGGSLTSGLALDGKKLLYGLDALTTAGKGKTGPDAAIAYGWQKLTGDKVWVVNTALPGTAISSWKKGGTSYKKTNETYSLVEGVMAAEEAAGHFARSHTYALWQQGEEDSKKKVMTSKSSYMNSFTSIFEEMVRLHHVEKIGIITTRARKEDTNGNRDGLFLDGVRSAQYALCEQTGGLLDHVFMASNIHEKWMTDASVRDYFQEADMSYPVRGTLKRPEKVSDIHGTIHYEAAAANELGFTAARNLFLAARGEKTETYARWTNEKGEPVSYVNKGGKAFFLSGLKHVSIQTGSGVAYEASSGKIGTSSDSTITAVCGDPAWILQVRVPVIRIQSAREKDGIEAPACMDQYGNVYTGWRTMDGVRYYFYKSTNFKWGKDHYKGVQATGWQNLDGARYYFYKSTNTEKYGLGHLKGAMATGWQNLDGARYYFYKSTNTEKYGKGHLKGAMATGWQNLDGGRYYFFPETNAKQGKNHVKGAMATGWQTIKGSRYYFGKDGRMVTGKKKIGRRTYRFGKDGRLKK